MYLEVTARSSVEARTVAEEVYELAHREYSVGFGPINPPIELGGSEKFLIATEFPTDGQIPVECCAEEEDLTGALAVPDGSLPNAAPTPDGCSATDEASDRLHAWLSAAAEGSWETFTR